MVSIIVVALLVVILAAMVMPGVKELVAAIFGFLICAGAYLWQFPDGPEWPIQALAVFFFLGFLGNLITRAQAMWRAHKSHSDSGQAR